jgi:hypothetical protein
VSNLHAKQVALYIHANHFYSFHYSSAVNGMNFGGDYNNDDGLESRNKFEEVKKTFSITPNDDSK